MEETDQVIKKLLSWLEYLADKEADISLRGWSRNTTPNETLMLPHVQYVSVVFSAPSTVPVWPLDAAKILCFVS